MTKRALLLALTLAASAAAAQSFEDRTFPAGLGSVTGANGVAVADYDGDGDLDLYVVVRAAYDAASTRTWSRLFANQGDGTFRDVTREAGVAGTAGVGLPNTGGNGAKLGAAWGDYDGDGDPDLYLTHAGPNQLYRNNGDGTFADVTAAAGVAGGPAQLSTSAVWFDADGDGDLDLAVGVWEDYAPEADLRNPFFENLGDGTFRPRPAAGLGDPGKTYAVLPFDADGDGDPDLYHANDFGANRFFLNDGRGTFAEATAAWGLENRGEGMGLALGDLDGDGREDVYLTNRTDSGAQSHALFMAQPDGGYVDRAQAAGVDSTGWAWGAEFFDAENDGDLDLAVVNGYFADAPNNLFLNDGGFPLRDVAQSTGVATRDAGRGLAVFDADGDGRLDLVVTSVSGAPRLYANRTASGAWLAVELEGAGMNRDGLGAVVEVEAGGQRWTKTHHGAQFLGQSLAPVHVGLGAAGSVDRVRVRWPGGAVDVAEGLAVGQRVVIREGEGLVSGRAVAAEGAGETGGALQLVVAPNPARGAVRLRVQSLAPARLTVVVSDALGREVHRLRQSVGAGASEVVWDPGALAAGVYVVRVSDGADTATAHLTVVR